MAKKSARSQPMFPASGAAPASPQWSQPANPPTRGGKLGPTIAAQLRQQSQPVVPGAAAQALRTTGPRNLNPGA